MKTILILTTLLLASCGDTSKDSTWTVDQDKKLTIEIDTGDRKIFVIVNRVDEEEVKLGGDPQVTPQPDNL